MVEKHNHPRKQSFPKNHNYNFWEREEIFFLFHFYKAILWDFNEKNLIGLAILERFNSCVVNVVDYFYVFAKHDDCCKDVLYVVDYS